MKLDVIVATHNRCFLLKEALESMLRAPAPPDLSVTVNVVDNNSSDETAGVVRDIQSGAPLRMRYLFEPRKGQAFAMNTGIASTDGDLVGFVDDDEQIDSSWYVRIFEAFQEKKLDFIGGPYIPLWGAPKPRWLPGQAKAIIGWLELSSVPRRYGSELPGVALCGGNAVFRRSILRSVGSFRTDLCGHHDLDMFERLLASGARGMYLPDLIIFHHIPAHRLRKSYFRQWMWRAGASYARIYQMNDGTRKIVGIPRYLFKKLYQSLIHTAWRYVIRDRACSQFEAELDLIYSISSAYAHFRLHKAPVDHF